MKFFSPEHLFVAITAATTTSLIMSDEYWQRCVGVALVVYGILILLSRSGGEQQ